MAFLDRLNDLAKNLGDKTTEALETTKLSSKISSERSAAAEELKKIGEFYYSRFAGTGEAEPEILEYCQSAKGHYDAAATAQAEISRMRAEAEAQQNQARAEAEAAAARPLPTTAAEPASDLVCPSCSRVNPPDTRFCCDCGTKLVPPAPPEQRFCPDCGAPVAEGLRFCGACGAKLF